MTQQQTILRWCNTTCLVFVIILLSACSDGVLTFPESDPARVRIVNTTLDVQTLSVEIQDATTVTAERGATADTVRVAAGRSIGFLLKEGSTNLRRDTLRYTLGTNGNIILFTYGSKANVVEFLQVIRDTSLSSTSKPLVRFTHIAQNVDQLISLDVWIKGGPQLFGYSIDLGLTSAYQSIDPGTYTFELREAGTNTIVAELRDVTIKSGLPYMLYAWDAAPPAMDQVSLSIF